LAATALSREGAVYHGTFHVTPQLLSTPCDRRNLSITVIAGLRLYHQTDKGRMTDLGNQCISDPYGGPAKVSRDYIFVIMIHNKNSQ